MSISICRRLLEGQVQIRQQAVGLNFIDVYFRDGTYKAPHLPFVTGQGRRRRRHIRRPRRSRFRRGRPRRLCQCRWRL